MSPVLSLIIPTYNCIRYLDETLGSVLSQLPDDFEVVIVDDGSSDGTQEELNRRREGFDDNIKVVLRRHEGPSSARNAGLDEASGEWAAFMDCDDCLMDDFFSKCRKVLEEPADLYIFSFERVDFIKGSGEGACSYENITPLVVEDRVYESTSDFADEYVRTRHLLVYSGCNKFYRKSLLDEHGIRFRAGLEFGEDRLFNYDYLQYTGRVVTTPVRMFRYMQRNPDSASKRSFPDYFNTIMMLHEAKMDCFLGLSEGTTEEEKKAFEEYDLKTEMERMADRR